jgi:predicted enzyme related to lactoylglutathione lyase
MSQGIRVVIYPVKDLAQVKALYSKLLGVEPYTDEAYYAGFRIGDQEMGLDPHGHNKGMTGPVGYWQVNDIQKSLQLLLDAGAQVQQGVHWTTGRGDCATVVAPGVTWESPVSRGLWPGWAALVEQLPPMKRDYKWDRSKRSMARWSSISSPCSPNRRMPNESVLS